MADKKTTELTLATEVNTEVDYVLIWDTSDTDTYNSNQRAVVRDLWDRDSDFKKLTQSPSAEDGDYVLIYDTSASGYRKMTRANFYSTPAAPSSKAYISGGACSNSAYLRVHTQLMSFSTVTFSVAVGADLSLARRTLCCLHGEGTYGWMCGGASAGGTRTNNIDKFTYATDTAAVGASVLPEICEHSAGLTEGTTQGYSCGGTSAGNSNRVNKITYATEVWTGAVAVISSARHFLAGLNAGSTKGYIGFRYLNGDIDKLTYATDAISVVYNNQVIHTANHYVCISEGTTHGYFIGGLQAAASIVASKLVYATDVLTLSGSTYLVLARIGAAGVSVDASDAYIVGGSAIATPGISDPQSIEHIDMTTDTTSAYGATVLVAIGYQPGSLSDTGF